MTASYPCDPKSEAIGGEGRGGCTHGQPADRSASTREPWADLRRPSTSPHGLHRLPTDADGSANAQAPARMHNVRVVGAGDGTLPDRRTTERTEECTDSTPPAPRHQVTRLSCDPDHSVRSTPLGGHPFESQTPRCILLPAARTLGATRAQPAAVHGSTGSTGKATRGCPASRHRVAIDRRLRSLFPLPVPK